MHIFREFLDLSSTEMYLLIFQHVIISILSRFLCPQLLHSEVHHSETYALTHN
jgi:hypothetical protein